MMKNILLCAAMLSLTGCFSLTSSKIPPTTYALHPAPYSGQAEGAPATVVVITVPEPALPAGFETDKIALYLQNGRRLDYYSGARWPGFLDEVLQDIIVETGKLAIPGVIFDDGDIRLPARYKLAVSVSDFSPVYQNGPEDLPLLKAAMTFTLIKMPDNIVITRFTKRSEQLAAANTLTAITTGLEALLQAILAESFYDIAPLVRSAAKRI